ncbi:MAG: hypothetical protein MJK04_33790, partial [Psychrosphaera sp.]|nr:hypothetical protein [Psychrosphaera sp.]
MSDSDTIPQQSDESDLELERKLAQFKEYFTIEQDINVNVIPLDLDEPLPSYDSFIRNMPYSFRLASEVSSI